MVYSVSSSSGSSDSSPVMLKKRSTSFVCSSSTPASDCITVENKREVIKNRSMSFPSSHSESAPQHSGLASSKVLKCLY